MRSKRISSPACGRQAIGAIVNRTRCEDSARNDVVAGEKGREMLADLELGHYTSQSNHKSTGRSGATTGTRLLLYDADRIVGRVAGNVDGVFVFFLRDRGGVRRSGKLPVEMRLLFVEGAVPIEVNPEATLLVIVLMVLAADPLHLVLLSFAYFEWVRNGGADVDYDLNDSGLRGL
jgi:hypothetical protein